MTQLMIKVRGELLSSNLDEWKQEIRRLIQSVNTELTTDAHFAQAETYVKKYKYAELEARKVKESAMRQAQDIQRLFSEINEISGEVRQVRLSLEKQIKQRKLQIKEEFVDQGVDNIKTYIDLKSADFQSIDHSDYLDRDFFREALRGKRGINGLYRAIEEACYQIKMKIDEKVGIVNQNVISLGSLSKDHQALFQDRSELLVLMPNQLDETIDKRIAFLERHNEVASNKHGVEPSSPGDTQVGPNDASEVKGCFMLTVELSATQTEADEFIQMMRSKFSDNPLVRRFQLEET